MDIIRTPDECFADLAGYPVTPRYLDASGLRIHYVDEGPWEADPVLLLHGEPTWSYMYRDTITALAATGHRVITPDLSGSGARTSRSTVATTPTSATSHGCASWSPPWTRASSRWSGTTGEDSSDCGWPPRTRTCSRASLSTKLILAPATSRCQMACGSGSDSPRKCRYSTIQYPVPGAKGQPHRLFPTGHFLTEDIGPELAGILLSFLSQP
jgi:hypothetical protein